MAFLNRLQGTLGDVVSGLVRMAWTQDNPYEVNEISRSQIQRCVRLSNDGEISLYKDGSSYFCIITPTESSTKCFRQQLYRKDILQKASDVLRDKPGYNCAHIAALCGFHDSFRHPDVARYINSPCDTTQITPIMVAVERGSLQTVKELIVSGAQLNMADFEGNSVFHFAARGKEPKIIQTLAAKDSSAIDQLNLMGESALHAACLAGKADNVEQANPNVTMSGRYPIHCAMKCANSRCVEILVKWHRDQLHVKDTGYGGAPIHWAKTKECIYTIADLGGNLDAINNQGESALLIMIKRHRLECIMALIARGANAAAVGNDGNNALHLAIKTDNASLVEALIVFGSDVNQVSSDGITPRHLAATEKGANMDVILNLLHRVGAQRCPPDKTGCTNGCLINGTYDGKPFAPFATTPESPKKFYDDLVADVAMAAAMARSPSASGSALMMSEPNTSVVSSGYRVLSLDGGGVRGLVLIQFLLALERVLAVPIVNCFDWIGGTSTGGILALALVHGKTTRYCQGLYFRLKDEVFTGKRPYDSEPLERFMKREFGENVRMADVEFPRVLVTAVLGDRKPADLHLFRNYNPPGFNYKRAKTLSTFVVPPSPSEQLVWRAARSSGAAPTYFRAMGRFLDGGLIANNPTLDLLTEIHEYNVGLRAEGKGEEAVQKLHVVLSLGTGKAPVEAVKAVDVYRPEGIMDVVNVAVGARALTELLVDQATQAEGRPVERARAWCSMIDVPFFRFSPQFTEDIPLDCSDDAKLIHMLYETEVYIRDNWHRVLQLASLLRR